MTDQSQRTLVLANGDPPPSALWTSLSRQASSIVCVDGGANAAVALGIRPDAIYGDFDSVTPETKEVLASCRWVLTEDQEFCDLDKTLQLLIEEGKDCISVVGAMGGLEDHSLANVGLLLKYRKTPVTYHTASEDIFLVEDTWTATLGVDRRVSLLPMFGRVYVSTQGLRYPLNDEALEMGVRDGLSNLTTGEPVWVTVRDNPVLVCVGRTETSAPVFAPSRKTAECSI